MEPWLHHVPKSLTAAHLMTPVVDFECMPNESVEEVLPRLRAALDDRKVHPELPAGRWAAVILRETTTSVDLVDFDLLLQDPSWLNDALLEGDQVDTHAHSLPFSNAVDGRDNFLVALEKLQAVADSEFDGETAEVRLAVRDGSRIGGLLRAEHLVTSRPVRVAMLSYLLELEDAVIERAVADPSGWQGCLSPARLNSARQRAKRQDDATGLCGSMSDIVREENRRARERYLLGATMFADKMTIIRKKKWHGHLSSHTDLGKLEKVRNWCAHTDYGKLPPSAIDLLFVAHFSREMIPVLRSN